MAASKNWMAEATKNKGAFTRQAKAADLTPLQLAQKALKKGSRATTKTKRRAVLAETLNKYRPGKK
jgi:hypothetical protein